MSDTEKNIYSWTLDELIKRQLIEVEGLEPGSFLYEVNIVDTRSINNTVQIRAQITSRKKKRANRGVS